MKEGADVGKALYYIPKHDTKMAKKKTEEAENATATMTPKEQWAYEICEAYVVGLPKNAPMFKTQIVPNEQGFGEEVKVPIYDVMYVTDDGNIFLKDKHGEAYSHARNTKQKLYTIRLKDFN